MKINDEQINIDDLISQKYMHKEIKKGLFLSEYQIEVLKKYNIDIDKISTINDLIFQIDEILEDGDCEDLEVVANELSEFYYYANTNK
ncbi:MAG: hypothetical protein PUA90_02085 [bacterium]|nr:hypothetical protein [bacterium]